MPHVPLLHFSPISQIVKSIGASVAHATAIATSTNVLTSDIPKTGNQICILAAFFISSPHCSSSSELQLLIHHARCTVRNQGACTVCKAPETCICPFSLSDLHELRGYCQASSDHRNEDFDAETAKRAAGVRVLCASRGKTKLNTVDAIHFAPFRNPSDDSPATGKWIQPWIQSGAKWISSTHSMDRRDPEGVGFEGRPTGHEPLVGCPKKGSHPDGARPS